jgi:pyruvate dehydrogenase E2 component (dihydrolipoamide acetyltransferase)
MSRDFKFADLGEGITEGELIKWLVKDGDTVKENQPVAEIETDKAIVEIPSPFEGRIEKLHHSEGDVVHVGDILISFSEEGEARPTVLPALATPHVRRLARELGIDISRVTGSGPGGRISEVDLNRFKAGKGVPSQRLEEPHEAGLTLEQFEKMGDVERVPLKGTRRKIAQHMVQTRRLTVPVSHIDEADVGDLVAVRNEMKPKAAERGAKLTFLPFIIRAVETGLRAYPALNASIVGNEIILKKYYNIGFAVDTEEGLLVPVVKNVENKSLLDIAVELLAELKGSTFSITNIGSIGGRFFTPVINYPDSAILAVGRIYEKPIVKEGQVVIRPVMSLSLTYDHRVTDGATGARFINHVIERLTDPQLLFMDID